jgi:beta-1,4-mannosyl-glycoprotein beta-1,4-N-acetylglucosaminyltransferase
MIIDCFTFYNELDMLECRLDYLYDKVDKFVLVEASITHSGKTKPMYFAENNERYSRYLDKIIYVSIDIDPSQYNWKHDQSKNFDNASWQVENLQRNGILKGIKDLPNDAVIMISDLDEIPNKDAIDRAIRMLNHKVVVSLETKFFIYNLGQHLLELWPATTITRNDTFTKKNTKPQALRDGKDRNMLIKNGGWHITYAGDVDAIRTKVMNFAHQEYNNEKFTDPSYIEQQIRLGQDLYGRPFPVVKVDINQFPENFLKCFGRYLPEIKLEHYAETVDGFFDSGDFEYYRKIVAQAKTGQHFVEVGSYKGRSSAFMAVEIALSGKQIQFDCVDTWKGSEEHQAGEMFEDRDVVDNRLYDVFLKNMELVKDYYRPVRATSLEAATLYEDNSIDMVFIDAAHDYDNVLADIKAWSPKVKSEGIISGHDWHHPPIKQAVRETLGEVSSIGSCWYVFKA